MRKYINNRVYDTDTAVEVGYRSSSEGRSSFGWFEETLYRKKTGEFFLYGNGHAASPYSQRAEGTMRGPGSRIEPLTAEEAEEWAQKHLSPEEYDAIFGEIMEDETQEMITLRVKASNAERIRREMTKTGKTAAQIVDELIENALK